MVVPSPSHSSTKSYDNFAYFQDSQFDSSDQEADINDNMDEEMLEDEDDFAASPSKDSGSTFDEDYEMDEEPSEATESENDFSF